MESYLYGEEIWGPDVGNGLVHSGERERSGQTERAASEPMHYMNMMDRWWEVAAEYREPSLALADDLGGLAFGEGREA